MTCTVSSQLHCLQYGCEPRVPAHISEALFNEILLKAPTQQQRPIFEFDFESEMSEAEMAGTITSGVDRMLVTAVSNGNHRMAQKYLNFGANPDAFRPGSGSALHLACSNGNVILIELLLRWGADPSPLDKHKRTPLHLACMPPHLGAMERLLSSGANPNIGNEPSTLHLAIQSGSSEAVKLLIKAGADINASSFVPYKFQSVPVSPLGLALQHKTWKQMVPMLLEAGAKWKRLVIDCEGRVFRSSALEVAMFKNKDRELLCFLIQNGLVPTGTEYDMNAFLRFQPKTFTRSVVGALLNLTIEGAISLDMMKNLIYMLEVAGYQLRNDRVCVRVFHSMYGGSNSSRFISSSSASQRVATRPSTNSLDEADSSPCLSRSQLIGIADFYLWGTVEFQPTQDMVDFFSSLGERLANPDGVPSLLSMCRDRVRSRLRQVNESRILLTTLVAKLPLPKLLREFVSLEGAC